MDQNQNKKRKVIILDDDKFLLNMYSAKFLSSGIEADTTETGDKLLEMLRAGATADLLLLDIIIPGLSGLETLVKIKEEGLAKDAKVVMLTNQSTEKDVEKAKSLGVQGYIVKATSTPSEVVDQVIKIIG
jgi:CheY-like chemotaxis protein